MDTVGEFVVGRGPGDTRRDLIAEIVTPHGEPLEIIATTLTEDSTRYTMKCDGEWHITY